MYKKELPYKNTLLHYRVIGKGEVVVLLHGFGEDSTIWDRMALSLKNKYCIIIPDIAGSGETASLVGEYIGMEDYAESIHAILIKENVQECTLIGHSMGGYITLAFAEKYPNMLHAFGLFHSSAFADDTNKKETRKKAIAFIHEKGAHAFLKTSIPGLFADAVKSKNDIDKLVEEAKQFSPEVLIQYYQAMIARPDRTHILKKFTLPILFLLGTYDKAVPFEDGLKQSHLPSIAHIHVLNNSAHMSMLEEPEKSLLKLEHFLATIYV